MSSCNKICVRFIKSYMTITANTRAIHHYDASWKSPVQKLKDRIIRILGADVTAILVKIKNF